MKRKGWLALGAVGCIYAFSLLGGKQDAQPVRQHPPETAVVKTAPKSEKAKQADATAASSPTSGAVPEPDTNSTRYVIGHRVAFRTGPSKDSSIIDRLDRGREVSLLEDARPWSRVRDKLTQREGWLSSKLLSDQKPNADTDQGKDTEKAPSPKKIDPPKVPSLSDATIIARIIAESVRDYPGNCPCPYNRDRAGRSCGRRSAYSKPGGYAPLCFPGDVTKAMVEAFRQGL